MTECKVIITNLMTLNGDGMQIKSLKEKKWLDFMI
jgi:hypothetical protein